MCRETYCQLFRRLKQSPPRCYTRATNSGEIFNHTPGEGVKPAQASPEGERLPGWYIHLAYPAWGERPVFWLVLVELDDDVLTTWKGERALEVVEHMYISPVAAVAMRHARASSTEELAEKYVGRTTAVFDRLSVHMGFPIGMNEEASRGSAYEK
ncbi:hypothetical protein C8Q79DRAFT_925350 [Trametes meyenii]|nr:hypothetical protein C8Q79DRAFT_925350 [Trametes meyenii]